MAHQSLRVTVLRLLDDLKMIAGNSTVAETKKSKKRQRIKYPNSYPTQVRCCCTKNDSWCSNSEMIVIFDVRQLQLVASAAACLPKDVQEHDQEPSYTCNTGKVEVPGSQSQKQMKPLEGRVGSLSESVLEPSIFAGPVRNFVGCTCWVNLSASG